MGYQPRILEKFENAAASISYAFPLAEYEWQTEQGLYLPEMPVTGANYGYDQLGQSSLAVKQSAVETLRFVVLETSPSAVDTALDEMMSEIIRCGRGKLFAIDSSSVRRWAWARGMSMPSLRWRAGDINRKAASIAFRRFSDWYGTTAFATDYTMDSSSESFNVVNDGNARVYNAVFILKGTFSDAIITNTTNGYRLKSTRDGSASGHWLKFDAGKNSVEFSTNSGSTYAGDWSNFVRQPRQVQLMVLGPGTNAFTATFTGTPSATLSVSFSHAFH